jgi:hypothetical protein
MSRLWRWANAVASTGTRAIAPPSTRSWATRMAASEVCSRSTISSAVRWPIASTNMVRPTAVGW